MKKFALLALLACSMVFAQGTNGSFDDEGFEDISGQEATRAKKKEPVPEEKVEVTEPAEREEPVSQVSAVSVDERRNVADSVPHEETWEEAWEKRRQNISVIVGFLPISALLELFVHDSNRDPDVTAYTVTYGYELFYLFETGVMVDYTTVNRKALVSVIPRLKLNYLNFKYIRLYSYLGVGVLVWNDGWCPMFNAAALGLELGGPVSAFGEVGWGQVGMFNFGMKFAF